jgi:cupin superfamily protein
VSVCLRIDETAFRRGFQQRGFLIEHSLADHPLLGLEALTELARRWPRASIECNVGHVPVAPDPARPITLDVPAHEVLQTIAERPSWVALKNLEADPAYRALTDRLLDEVRGLSEAASPGMCTREAFVFVSSAGSVTPFHMDPEHNFLLQIRGSKTIAQYDPLVLSEQEIERFYMDGQRSLKYREELDIAARRYELRAGSGLYFPVTTPHWVKVGSEPSISLSITFRTEESNRREHVYRMNAHLRRFGLRPTPYGRSRWRDALKEAAFVGARSIHRLTRRPETNRLGGEHEGTQRRGAGASSSG